MLINKRTASGLAASVVLCGFLVLSSFAAPPPGKGGGGGGGEEPPPPPELPAGLNVRYRVQFIPLREDYDSVNMQAVNDSYEAVGWYSQSTSEGNVNKGFYYNAATNEALSATDMLPSLTGSTQFVGINNFGWIVGSLADSSGFRTGILIYPDSGSTSGWSYELVLGPDNTFESYARHINDYGDIVGVYWRLNADGTQGLADAYAYNPGLDPDSNLLEATPLNLGEAHLYSIQVSNQRRGLAVDYLTGDAWWFDFLTNSVEPVSLPPSFYINVTGLVSQTLSDDGQLAVAKEIVSSQKRKGSYTYTYTPGVVQDGTLLWEGEFDGRTFCVNSTAPGNQVGDAVGYSNGFDIQWLQHANWGYLDIESMLVFDPPTANELSDQELWSLGNSSMTWMSNRDSTGVGMLAGRLSGARVAEVFVLVPEEITLP